MTNLMAILPSRSQWQLALPLTLFFVLFFIGGSLIKGGKNLNKTFKLLIFKVFYIVVKKNLL